MDYKEINGDLFTAPQGYCLAHCISGDYALAAGIAVEFDKRFNMRKRLKNYCEIPDCPSVIKIDNVFNLITKECGYQRPTYDNLYQALWEMRQDLETDCIKKIAMPQIGCGLDGLNWNIVKAMIKEVFSDIDVEIVVYIYDPNQNKNNEKWEVDDSWEDEPDSEFGEQMTFDNYACCEDSENNPRHYYGYYD